MSPRVRPDQPPREKGSKKPNTSGGSRLPASVRTLSVERRLQRGEVLFRKDDTAIGLYAVEEGHVRLCRVDANGREITLHTAGPGDLVAEASLFSPRYHCDAVMLSDAPACASIRRKPFSLNSSAIQEPPMPS